MFNPLNAELNPICHLLALLEAHHIFHISRLRVNVRHALEISSGDVVSTFESFICYMISSSQSSASNQVDAELLLFGWCMNLVSEGLWFGPGCYH